MTAPAAVNRTRIVEALIIAGLAAIGAGMMTVQLNKSEVREVRATLGKIEKRVESTGHELGRLRTDVAVVAEKMGGIAGEVEDAKTERRGTNDWLRSLRDRQIDHERNPHDAASGYSGRTPQ